MAEPSSTPETTAQPEIQEAPVAEKVEETTPTATTTEEDQAKQVEGEKKEVNKEVKEVKEEKEEKKEYEPQLKENGSLYKFKSHSRVGGFVAPLAWHHRFFKFGGQEDKCEPHKLHEYYRRNAPRKPTVPPKDDAPKEGEATKAEAPQEGKDTESGAVDNSKYLHSTIAHARKTGEGLLFYYKNEKAQDRVYGLINLAEVDFESIGTTTEVNKAHAFKFKVPKANREFFFYTEAENDCKDWVHTIKHRVQKAQSSCKSVQDSTEYKEAYEKLAAGHYFGPEAGSEPEPLSSEDDRADSPKPVPNDKRKSYFTSFQAYFKGSQTSEPELKETAEPAKPEAAGTAPESAGAASGAPEDKKTPPKPEKKPSLLSNISSNIPALFSSTSEKKHEKKEGEEKVEGGAAVESKPEEKKEAEKKEPEKKEGEKKEVEKKEVEEQPGIFRKMTLNWRRKTDEKKPEAAKAEAETTAQPAEGAKSTETDKKPGESATDAGAASATDAASPAAEKPAEKPDEKPTHTQEGSSSEDKKGTSLLRRLSTFPSKKTTKPQSTPLGETQEEQKQDETVKATAAEAAEQQPTTPAQPSESELKIKEEASKARLSGHLSKKKQYLPGVEKRFFIFTQEGSIDYYESESDRAPPKHIQVNKKCAVRKTAEKNFELEVQSRTYRFTANSPDECQKWVDEITKYRDSLPEEEKDKEGDKRDKEVTPMVNGDQQESLESSVQAAGTRAAEETEAAKAAKAAQAETDKVEAAKVEAAKVDADKVDADKVDGAKVDAAKVDAAKVEAAKVEPATVETQVVSETTATPPASSTVTTSSPAAVTSTDDETTTTTTKTTETTQTSEGGYTTTVTSVETTEVVTSSA